MNLKQLITPKNEDGSIDHRYTPIAQSIADLAGERVEAQLRKLYSATSDLEKEYASAGLQLVIAMFSIPMDERFERFFLLLFRPLALRSSFGFERRKS